MDSKAIKNLEQALSYEFTDKHLIQQAMCHSSFVDHRLLSNERLEFFGDSVLSLVICQTLFEQLPNAHEGSLTEMRSMIVSRLTCTRVTKNLDISPYIKVGKGISNNKDISDSILAGVIEAVIAAIYLDGGLEAARDFILTSFAPYISLAKSQKNCGNYKSALQQYAQQQFGTTPNYDLMDEKGPDHNKCFEYQVSVKGQVFPSAWGTNKKRAEQKAAFNALIALKLIDDGSEFDLIQ